jgi:hypothetical protein
MLITVIYQHTNHYASPLFLSAMRQTVQEVNTLETAVFFSIHRM